MRGILSFFDWWGTFFPHPPIIENPVMCSKFWTLIYHSQPWSIQVPHPDSVPVIVMKNSEPELLYILAESSNICRREFCFLDFWKDLDVIAVFKNVRERSTPKNYCLVSLLSVVSRIFEKLVNNRPVDHLTKYGLFPDVQIGFRTSINCRPSDSCIW